MRRVFLCLVTLLVCAACTTEPETTMQVQGTVTAADDGSPIVGASVQVLVAGFTSGELRTRVQTNNQGDYSLSFIEMGFCPEALFTISASAQGFKSVALWGLLVEPDATHLRCTDEPQTIDFQLERGTGWAH